MAEQRALVTLLECTVRSAALENRAQKVDNVPSKDALRDPNGSAYNPFSEDRLIDGCR
jgi:hypothetical protein